MAVQLPPWLQIDPIAPARIKLQANQQRNAAAASERASQDRAAELDFRRQSLNAQLAQQEAHDEAVERSAVRREQVLKQTNDQELAQAAQQLQMKREVQAEKSRQFEQQLRIKQQAAEQEARTAAKQMLGMQNVQKGLKEGTPIEKLLMENAPDLFAGRPQDMLKLMPNSRAIDPSTVRARELLNDRGEPTGAQWIPGAGGSIKTLQRQNLSPEGVLRNYQIQLGVIGSKLSLNPDDPNLLKEQARLVGKLQEMTSGRGAITPNAAVTLPRGTATAPAPGPLPAAAAAPTPAQAREMIRIKNGKGEEFNTYKAEWESSSPEERKGWEVVDEEAETVTEEEE